MEEDDDYGSETQENFVGDDRRDGTPVDDRREGTPNDIDVKKDIVDDEELAAFFAGTPNKRFRKNAKAVECLDLAGNIVGHYQSGIAAVRALGIQQGDISLCCRGLKDSVNGYRFRFVAIGDDEQRRMSKLIEDNSLVTTRFTRNRADAERNQESKPSILASADLKVRSWKKVPVQFGSLTVTKWASEEAPSAALQEFNTAKKSVINNKKRRRSKPGEV